MQTPILIIDDDTKLGSLLRDYLEPNGFQVDLAYTGPAGLEQAARTDYAAIILDVMLPGMNGYEVLRELRRRSSTPVLMFTALGAEPDRIAGLNVGADDYLPKTFSTTELLARLRALVRRASITEQQRQEREEDRREMEQARDIQRALLPRSIPSIEGIDIAGIWKPAKAVSGDYYDVLPIGGNKTAICIGDVSGKGMPAALLMANVQAAVKAFAPQNVSPAELCRRVNRILCGNASDGRYMSFFYGVFDQSVRQFAYTCAGHNPPILIRKDGSEVRLTEGGTLLGIFADSDYEIGEVTLGRGDRLVLFTDGVTEAIGADEEFGEERLLGIIRKSGDSSAAALAGSIIDAVSGFSGNTFHDDLTLVALRVVH
jgi:sigma-B regulation protein RsbU (phosphoserine phosphatase)